MNSIELVATIAEKAERSNKDSDTVVKAFIEVVTEEFVKGEKIQLNWFGTFEIIERAVREGRNPLTGAPTKVVAWKAPKFKF